ncbi:hypothetical protein OHB04_22740 [Streptomyces sp. NBC_01775]|uniref:hypothetical protein n=1 Tax=Streptomyces sp. NBC_01775 TaxID=2975939 RepID=UPI002DDB5512|nr:hypothetical protein [Streptomyces sp. NBC_01775]WSB78312.1 hypothetical protein OHB04_22740 [Streptomyces sp. NBC_01775]
MARRIRADRAAWRFALAVVSGAALAVTGWSLYAVARHYDSPHPVAGLAVAVFDGAAYACLHLASQASAAGRSAFGARLAALGIAALSVYLNRFHAELIDGGRPATVFFSTPTLALLVVSELAWAGPRAKARAELGRTPYALPVFGGWGWLLAPRRAWDMVRTRAADHIERAEPAPRKDRDVSATSALRDHFATMDPAEAIRIGHGSQPELAPGELAALLGTYGVHVDAVQVALVLGGTPPRITVEREPDTVRTGPDSDAETDARIALARADMLSGQRPQTMTEAVRHLVERGITERDIVVPVTCSVLGPDTNPDSVRRTLEREKERADAEPEPRRGEGGYI